MTALVPDLLASFPGDTRRRLKRLQTYMAKNVLGPRGFCCTSFAECSGSVLPGDRFFEGQLSHVGRHFDLRLNNQPLRIVVVGQEYGITPAQRAGQKPRPVSLADRYAMIHDGSGLGRRYYKGGTHPSRNPHMRGTTSALRILFGNGIGSDVEGEYVTTEQGDRFHLFDAFALVNVLLCSAGPPQSSTGRSTNTMRRNCLRHFAETLNILEPTVVVLQGSGVQAWTSSVLEPRRQLTRHLWESEYRGRPTLVCGFSHPSARGDLRWGDRLDAPYLTDTVKPTLELARRSLHRLDPMSRGSVPSQP